MNQLMTVAELAGRRVLSQDGHLIGDIDSLTVDTTTWQVVEVAVRLRREALEALSVQKPMFGTETVQLPSAEIAGVSDTVVLRRPLAELRDIRVLAAEAHAARLGTPVRGGVLSPPGPEGQPGDPRTGSR